MDTELARTFLEIVSSGSFIRAAERLNVAQTTVSARIRTLEERIGRPLFIRNKAGAALTPAGKQFLRYAPTFVQLWERARNQVAVPPGHRTVLAIGGETSLWQPLLADWVIWMRRSLPDVALRVLVDVPEDLLNQVAAGVLDAAVLHAPAHKPGLKIDLVPEEKLVLVTTYPGAEVNYSSFVSVDWGADFADEYSASFPDAVQPGLSANLGPLALSYILSSGGSGYFRLHVVEPYITAGKLHLVQGAPQFSYPIYIVYSIDSDDVLLQPALTGLHMVAMSEESGPAG